MRNIIMIVSSFLVLSLVGCQLEDGVEAEVNKETIVNDEVITNYDGEQAPTYDVVYTLDEVLALTFDRILPKKN